MNKSYKYLLVATGLTLMSMSCKEPEETTVTKYVDTSLNVPSKYEFDSRFDAGVSSVDHGGQTVRNLLIQDIKTIIDNAANEATPSTIKASVLALYNYNDNNTKTLTEAGSYTIATDIYENISSGKNLSDKIDGDVVIGFTGSKTADDLIMDWLDQIDANIISGATGADIYTTADSTNLNQLINKVLTGAVAYSQGTSKYLTIALTEDNNVRDGGNATYTTREHVWDEAFGYFGAAIDYNSFTNDDLASKNGGTVYKDANGDNKIDFNSEYNFGIATNAGKRERVTETTQIETYLRRDAYNAFLAGRTAITNQRTDEETRIYATQAAQAWEKIIAATIIHYINEVNNDLDDRINNSVVSKYDLYTHWSEMKGFMVALQYGSDSYQLISISDLTAIHAEIGEKPDLSNPAAYKQTLLDVADDLRKIYNFDETNVNAWRFGQL